VTSSWISMYIVEIALFQTADACCITAVVDLCVYEWPTKLIAVSRSGARLSSAVPFVKLQAFPHWGSRIKVKHCCQLMCIICRSLRIGSSRNTLYTKRSFCPLISVTSYFLLSFHHHCLGSPWWALAFLTLCRLPTYIYMYRTANLQTLHFKYLFNKYPYWIF
jgi:hypothetical protein